MCQSQGNPTMVKIRDFFDPFPEAKILKSNKLLGQYLAEKYGVDCLFFKTHVITFKAKYYGKCKRNKKSFLHGESNWLDRKVPFARAVKQTTKTAAKKARKAFSELGPKQKKEPGQLEAAARIEFKAIFDSFEKNCRRQVPQWEPRRRGGSPIAYRSEEILFNACFFGFLSSICIHYSLDICDK